MTGHLCPAGVLAKQVHGARSHSPCPGRGFRESRVASVCSFLRSYHSRSWRAHLFLGAGKTSVANGSSCLHGAFLYWVRQTK